MYLVLITSLHNKTTLLPYNPLGVLEALVNHLLTPGHLHLSVIAGHSITREKSLKLRDERKVKKEEE